MKTPALVVAILLTGCAPDTFEGMAYYTCSDNVFTEVRYSEPADCDKSRAITDLAGKLLTDSGYWENPKANAPLVVFDTDYLTINGKEYSGYTYIDRIEVDKREGSVLHELIHARNAQRVEIEYLVDGHNGWFEKGFYGLSNLFVYAMFSPIGYGIGLAPGYCGYEPQLSPTVDRNLRARGWGPMIDERELKVRAQCKNVGK